MIVVSNTSPLTNLAVIGQFHLLEMLYTQIWIPEAVVSELNANGVQWPGSQQTRQAPWIRRQQVTNRALVTTLQADLDQGEAEAYNAGFFMTDRLYALALDLAGETTTD